MNFSRSIRVLAIRVPSVSIRSVPSKSIHSSVPRTAASSTSTRAISTLQFAAAAALSHSPISTPTSFSNTSAPFRSMHSTSPSLSSASESATSNTQGANGDVSESSTGSGTSSASARGSSGAVSGEELSSDDEVGKREKIDVDRDKKFIELQDSYRRLLADMENLRTRTNKEKTAASVYAIQKFAQDLLETADILNVALSSVTEAARESKEVENLYMGVSMTRTELLRSLKRHGVEEFNPIGEKFNPDFHNALLQTESDSHQPGTISTVIKTGWMLKDRVLRPASVGVVKDKS
ncbi:GrpE protein, mitochondrial [Nowakowskiella sp. JEL0078]|nr:GrpE protein, mitochondrial [Nowakowskiella sp. JEL0078]